MHDFLEIIANFRHLRAGIHVIQHKSHCGRVFMLYCTKVTAGGCSCHTAHKSLRAGGYSCYTAQKSLRAGVHVILHTSHCGRVFMLYSTKVTAGGYSCYTAHKSLRAGVHVILHTSHCGREFMLYCTQVNLLFVYIDHTVRVTKHYEYHAFIYLLQHVSADLYGHRQEVVQIHKKKCILGGGLPFTDSKYDISLSWLLLQVVDRIKPE
jgi:hypothetical protein